MAAREERETRGTTPWSRPVRAQADRLRAEAGRLRADAEGMTLPGAEGTVLRRRIASHAERAERAARSLEHAAEALARHEALLAALARGRRESGGATQRD
ncbi:hypothetical protein M1P56_10410 [Streptomyces sp. HU2014]|uniref:hypothetical protein n=1 Tax=Streptomyces sp. HU2014 TaxID=2939414 RepID=UPI000B444522|nr:hypothetical protein [Streptomyces sp. HU2014]UQI44731.1 hypothetical protein M1P56_10410 [Streptomyces sp. HU2014]